MTNDHDKEIAKTNKDPAEIIAKALGMEFTKAEAAVTALDEAGYTFVPNKLLSTIEKASNDINVLVRACMKMRMI